MMAQHNPALTPKVAGGDPSHNVHEQLIPHVHLLNTFRFPMMPRIDTSEIQKYLSSAPKIARDSAPFYWTYLDCPTDGSVFLTWQSLHRMGTEFASDGYIWAGGEIYLTTPLGNGVILETFIARAGYAPGDQYATHTRRRFRFMTQKVPGQTPVQIDPALWLVHYGPTENIDRIPVQSIPFDPRTHQMMSHRVQLQRAGQIQRKDFMLSDRSNWPQIPLPREGRGQPVYPTGPSPRGVPQQMAYPPHSGPSVGPPSKRPRHSANASAPQHPHMMPGTALEGLEDEEDNYRGDMFDHITPREVSMNRFLQNHEWMEEILASPYRVAQITQPDLGLGLKGTLGSVTEGIFEAQGSNAQDEIQKKPYVGRLDEGLAEEFRKRVNAKLESTNAEIQQMKAQHAEMLAKLSADSVIKQAEHDLRFAVSETGPESWRLEGRQEEDEEFAAGKRSVRHKKLEDIIDHVEQQTGIRALTMKEVERVQVGGYQEPMLEPVPESAPEPVVPPQATPAQGDVVATSGSAPMSRQTSGGGGSPVSGVMVGDSDVDMGGTAAGLLDEMHTGVSPTSTTPVNNFPTPQAHLSTMPSAANTPINAAAPSPQNPPPTQDEYRAEDMEGVESSEAMPTAPADAISAGVIPTGATSAGATPAADQGTGSGDWVMVPKGGISPSPGAAAEPSPDAPASEKPSNAATLSNVAMPVQPAVPAEGPSNTASAVPTPGMDGNDFSSLGDLDGDALAGYDPPAIGGPGELGAGLDLNMDESAFGDAFHGVNESREGGGDTSGGVGQGMGQGM